MRNIDVVKMENVTSASQSSVYINSVCDSCTVQVYGTATAMKVQIQGMTDIASNSWNNLGIINMSDFSLIDGDDGITSNGIYSVMIEGVTQIRVNVASVTGSLNVMAKFANTSVE